MKISHLFGVAAMMSASFFSAGSSTATVLLNLINAPVQSSTPYSLPFVAVDSTTTVTIEGYNVHAFEYSESNGVFLGGAGPNLLGPTWEFTPAADGSAAGQIDDGTAVAGLYFGGLFEGEYDAFSQTFATTPGSSYTVELLYTNPESNNPTGFMVTTTGASTVPEPSTWAMMLLGFAGLGYVGYRTTRKAASIAA
jgi:hypothetical protein